MLSSVPGLDADTFVVRLFATNVSAALGDGRRDLVTLTNGEALFQIKPNQVAGRASGTVALSGVPGVRSIANAPKRSILVTLPV